MINNLLGLAGLLLLSPTSPTGSQSREIVLIMLKVSHICGILMASQLTSGNNRKNLSQLNQVRSCDLSKKGSSSKLLYSINSSEYVIDLPSWAGYYTTSWAICSEPNKFVKLPTTKRQAECQPVIFKIRAAGCSCLPCQANNSLFPRQNLDFFKSQKSVGSAKLPSQGTPLPWAS